MPVTALEILDTAVKIGLGALISAASAYGLARMNHSRELVKEFTKRKRDTLESIAEKLELAHKRYVEFIFLYSNVLGHRSDVKQMPAEEFETIMKGMTDLLPDLLSAQTRLLLLGEERAAQLLGDYLESTGEALDQMNEERRLDLSEFPDRAKAIKQHLLGELSRAYRT